MKSGLVFFCLLSLGLSEYCNEGSSEFKCPDYRVSSSCKCKIANSTILCCHLNSIDSLKQTLKACGKHQADNVTHLHLRNVTLKTFDANQRLWKGFDALTITESKITELNGTFRGGLECITLSGIGLLRIDDKAFTSLEKLHFLNISNNNLTSVPGITPSEGDETDITLDVSGNSHIRCHSVNDLLDGLQNFTSRLRFANDNSSFCLSSKSFNWFNSTETVPLVQLVMLKKLQFEQKCPSGPTFKCHCSTYRVDILPGKFPTYNAKVDCSGQNLTSLPPELPPNTKLLNVSNNNITSLFELTKKKSYHDIREFYADNNQIKSISELEGSYFIDHFSVLSLKGNNLTSIPTYFLSNAFEKTSRIPTVQLGGNRLNCDCNAALVLKVWLLTNKEHIPDNEEVLCTGDLGKVVFLDQNKVCVSVKVWTDYIYYIIAGECFLLVLLIGKVSYDYWIFKTRAYLPWPASKMPKLPCDWVCEY